jgi:hypothetical protein
MTKKDIALCEKNFSKFMEGRDYLDQFINEIKDQLNEKFNPPRKISEQSWDGSIALRLKLSEKDYPDIVLCLCYNNSFLINIYYDNRSHKNISELSNIVGEKYSQKFESGGKIICFSLKENHYFGNLKDAYKEIEIQWNNMKKIYT